MRIKKIRSFHILPEGEKKGTDFQKKEGKIQYETDIRSNMARRRRQSHF